MKNAKHSLRLIDKSAYNLGAWSAVWAQNIPEESDCSMAKGYRYYETDFQPGYVDTPTADHLPNLSPDKQKAEIVIRAGDKRGRSRAHALFVFENLDVATALLGETKGEQLYEMSIDDKDVLHRADLRIYDEIVAALKAGRDADGLIREFWAGIERPSPRIELTVMKATVVRKVVDNT